MKLRSPAETYIKYLTVHPDGYDDAKVKAVFEDFDLDYISLEYIHQIRMSIHRPNPFRPMDRSHSKSFRFLQKEGIFFLFHPDAPTKTAFRILETPRAKEFVEAMLLSTAPLAAIAHEVTRRGTPCTEAAVAMFKKFFWNIDLLSTSQMRTLLAYRTEMAGGDGDNASKEDRALKKAMKKASFLDPRTLAADVPNSPVTALMSQMRMGLMPSKLDLARILQLTQAMASMRALEATLYGSPQDSMRALNFSIVAKNITDVLETAVRPDEDLRERLQAVALATDTHQVPTIHQLSAGQHTVDLQPIPESKDESVAEPGPDHADSPK